MSTAPRENHFKTTITEIKCMLEQLLLQQSSQSFVGSHSITEPSSPIPSPLLSTPTPSVQTHLISTTQSIYNTSPSLADLIDMLKTRLHGTSSMIPPGSNSSSAPHISTVKQQLPTSIPPLELSNCVTTPLLDPISTETKTDKQLFLDHNTQPAPTVTKSTSGTHIFPIKPSLPTDSFIFPSVISLSYAHSFDLPHTPSPIVKHPLFVTYPILHHIPCSPTTEVVLSSLPKPIPTINCASELEQAIDVTLLAESTVAVHATAVVHDIDRALLLNNSIFGVNLRDQATGSYQLGFFNYSGPDPPVHYTSPLPRPDPDPPNTYSSNRDRQSLQSSLWRVVRRSRPLHPPLPPLNDGHSGRDPFIQSHDRLHRASRAPPPATFSPADGQSDFNPFLPSASRNFGLGHSSLLVRMSHITITNYPAMPNGCLLGVLTILRELLDTSTVAKAIGVNSCWYEDKTDVDLLVLNNGTEQIVGEATTGAVCGGIGVLFYRPLFTVRTKRSSQSPISTTDHTSFLDGLQGFCGAMAVTHALCSLTDLSNNPATIPMNVSRDILYRFGTTTRVIDDECASMPTIPQAGRVTSIDPIAQIIQRCIHIVKNIATEVRGCVLCRGHDSSKSGFNPCTILLCDQYEKEFHGLWLTYKAVNGTLRELAQDHAHSIVLRDRDPGMLMIFWLLIALTKEIIRQASCGAVHVVALSIDILLQAWGYNEYGQLGRGITCEGLQGPCIINVSVEFLVEALEFMKITQMSCGGYMQRLYPQLAGSILGGPKIWVNLVFVHFSLRIKSCFSLRIHGWGYNSCGQATKEKSTYAWYPLPTDWCVGEVRNLTACDGHSAVLTEHLNSGSNRTNVHLIHFHC